MLMLKRTTIDLSGFDCKHSSTFQKPAPTLKYKYNVSLSSENITALKYHRSGRLEPYNLIMQGVDKIAHSRFF